MPFQEVIDILVNLKTTAQKGFKKLNKEITQTVKGIGNTVKSFKDMHLEFLSTLFFGMSLQRMFGDVSAAGFDLMGTNDLLTAANQVLAVQGFDPARAAADAWAKAILGADPATQALIGTTQNLLATLGGLLMVFSQIALGLAGLKIAFGINLITPLVGAGTAIVGFVASAGTAIVGFAASAVSALASVGAAIYVALGPIGILLLAVTAFAAAYATNFLGIRDITNAVLGGLMSAVKGFAMVLIAIVDKIKEAGAWIYDAALGFGSWLVRGIVDGIKAIGHMIADTLLSFIPAPIRSLLGGLANSILGNIPVIGSFLKPFAAGGIVTGPTPALVGESGPEAIIPLDRAGTMGGVNLNVTYNIQVSDKAQLESLMRKNNDDLVREVRRLTLGG